ncbi:MAG TPA: hypothetical protein VGD56_01835 [Gemmatirosa sp.]
MFPLIARPRVHPAVAATTATLALVAFAPRVHAQPATVASGADSAASAAEPGDRPAISPRATLHHLDAAVTMRAGTLGAGVEVGKLVTDHLAVRAGYFGSSFNVNRTVSNIAYAGRVQLRGASVLADLFPSARGAFHFTGGVVLNGPRVTAAALPGTDGTITLNHHAYSTSELGQLGGKLAMRPAAPYVGFGFGTPARKSAVALVADVGAMIGAPTFTLNASNAAGNPALQSDLRAQQATTQQQISRYGRVVPVSSIGLAVRF